MTAAEKPLEAGAVNGTSKPEAPEVVTNGNGNVKILDHSIALQQGLNRRVVFMRKLGVGEGLAASWHFDPPAEGEDVVQHTVALKRLIIDHEADLEELCVLQIETKIDTGDTEKFPLAYLGKDSMQVPLELFLSEQATIRLVKGKGPVYLIGEYAEEWRDDEAEVDESCVEADTDPETEEETTNSVNNTPEQKTEKLPTDRKRKLEGEDNVAAKKAREDKDNQPMDETEEEAAST